MSQNISSYRIERLWRDVHSKVTIFYADMFRLLEKDGLDISNTWHLFALQYLFLPRIQDELNQFQEIWNNHKITGEKNKTPLQLMALRDHLFPFVDDVDEYGRYDSSDDEHSDVEHNELPAVNCTPLKCPLNEVDLLSFKRSIAPLSLDTPIAQLVPWLYTAVKLLGDYQHDP
jgi:hypothetical protein